MPNWSKEDRAIYEKSEVLQELEKLTIANIYRLDLLAKKAQSSTAPTVQGVKELTEAMKGLAAVKKEVGFAEDQLSEPKIKDESMFSGTSRELAERMMNESMDDKISDAVVNELMEMKEAAIKEGNTKLAYKIERTLDEILSVETI